MKNILEVSKDELKEEYSKLKNEYDVCCSKGLSLDMSRGKPSSLQLDISNEILTILDKAENCISDDGVDCRNYGMLDGIPEVKELFAPVIGAPAKNLIIGGNSSLALMYDLIAKAMTNGLKYSPKPWALEEKRKFLCPAPGYDRHFAITESFGFELITVPMREDGPDMDMVEELVKDSDVKGIWCVPKYSNPEGITYSDDVVRRFAKLKTAAPDFAVMWDNAYIVHDLYDEHDEVLNLFEESKKYGTQNHIYTFISTSKITFPGSGVSVMAASDDNIEYIKSLLFYQTISYDKVNQMRHLKFFGDADGMIRHMERHADILRPKFRLVIDKLESNLGGSGCGSWIDPKGGYFISFNSYPGCAKRIVELASKAGIKLTSAGAAYPYGIDPQDRNIRLAPSYPTLDELSVAMDIFCVCAKLAAVEKLLNE